MPDSPTRSPAPPAPPTGVARSSFGSISAAIKSFGSLPRPVVPFSPRTPRVTVTKVVPDSSATSPGSVASFQASVSTASELEEDRRRLRLLKIKAEKLANSGWRKAPLASFPLAGKNLSDE